MLIAGIGLFIVGIVATVGVPGLDAGLTDSPDEDSDGDPPGIDEPDEQEETDDGDERETENNGEDANPEDDGNGETDGGDVDELEEEDEDDAPVFGEEGEADEDDPYTYSATIQVTDADSGDPIEGVPVELYPVDAESEQYTTDAAGEVTIEFEHTEADDSFEYVLAVGEGERIIEIEQDEQTEPVPLSSDPDDLNGADDG
jgi:hypothetical protein